jgi:hypothetical protein
MRCLGNRIDVCDHAGAFGCWDYLLICSSAPCCQRLIRSLHATDALHQHFKLYFSLLLLLLLHAAVGNNTGGIAECTYFLHRTWERVGRGSRMHKQQLRNFCIQLIANIYLLLSLSATR